MNRFAWVSALALLTTVAAVRGEKPQPLQFQPIPPPGFQPEYPQDRNYKAPKGDGAVVELLDEGVDALIPVLINDAGETGIATREDRDVFAGVEAVRVTPMQRYRGAIPGWGYKIVENPKNANEFRYLRFAWKKLGTGGLGIMIQFHDPVKTWAFRFHAGANIHNWQPSTQVSDKLPTEWQLHTRDLFKEYGAFTISGFALSPLDGSASLFDHMLLGRTVKDLDEATDAALGRVKPAKALERAEVAAHWENLMGADRVKAATAQRALLATAPDHVAFIETQLGKLAIDKDQAARVKKYVADLDADSFEARDTATDELVKLGGAATEAVRALANSGGSDELKYRARLILKRIDGGNGPVGQAGRLSRAVRVLERANTAPARALLAKVADGDYGFDVAPEAKAALARMPKSP